MPERYVLGYVCGETVSSMWVDCLIKIMGRDMCPILRVFSGSPIHGARDEVVKGFLGGKYSDTLVMVDTDIIFEPEHVDALLAHDRPIVSGVYPSTASWSPAAEIILEGCGFMAVKKEVFEAVGEYPFAPIIMKDGHASGEDVGFRVKARLAGYDTYVDDDIRVGHIKSIHLRLPTNLGGPIQREGRYDQYAKEYGDGQAKGNKDAKGHEEGFKGVLEDGNFWTP